MQCRCSAKKQNPSARGGASLKTDGSGSSHQADGVKGKDFENIFSSMGSSLISELLSNPEALSSLIRVNKLFGKRATSEEKSAAVFGLLSNPFVFELAKGFFMMQEKNETYTETPYSPSEEAAEAFRPVAPVAEVEITEKLCHLYDNWYIKK